MILILHEKCKFPIKDDQDLSKKNSTRMKFIHIRQYKITENICSRCHDK